MTLHPPHATAMQRGTITLLGVIALHLALWLLLRDSTSQPRKPTAPAMSTVRLRLLPSAPAAPAPALAREAKPAAAAAGTRGAPAPISLAVPSMPSPSSAASEPARADAAALPASQPQRQLDLALPRGFATRPDARNPALGDPRASSARTTPEQRISSALDTRVTEEDFGDGRRRFRQGENCAIVSPSRIAQLMPFNDAAARTPSVVSACP
ncbi:MAG: hypothetical protein H7Y61_13235 [Rhizobiales bacterium]|nr:hypothetical protein [Rhizobacter sp.]